MGIRHVTKYAKYCGSFNEITLNKSFNLTNVSVNAVPLCDINLYRMLHNKYYHIRACYSAATTTGMRQTTHDLSHDFQHKFVQLEYQLHSTGIILFTAVSQNLGRTEIMDVLTKTI